MGGGGGAGGAELVSTSVHTDVFFCHFEFVCSIYSPVHSGSTQSSLQSHVITLLTLFFNNIIVIIILHLVIVQ